MATLPLSGMLRGPTNPVDYSLLPLPSGAIGWNPRNPDWSTQRLSELGWNYNPYDEGSPGAWAYRDPNTQNEGIAPRTSRSESWGEEPFDPALLQSLLNDTPQSWIDNYFATPEYYGQASKKFGGLLGSVINPAMRAVDQYGEALAMGGLAAAGGTAAYGALGGAGAVAGGGLTAAEAALAGSAATQAVPAGADYSGPEFQGEVPPQSTGPGPTYDAFGKPIGGGGYFPAGSAGAGALGSAAAGSALSRIIDGKATTADWVSVLGTAGATGLGMYSANQQANSLEQLAAQSRADRAPFLGKANEWLANPEAYTTGPGQAALQGTLAGLSARFGNPIGSGTALQLASGAGLQNWQNAVTGMANLGLSGEDTRAQLGIGASQAQADIYGNLAGGISRVVNPPRSLADLARELRAAGLA